MSTLCESNHASLKADDPAWIRAAFSGYQPLGRQLGDIRHCPVCQSTVVRPVAFTSALIDVLEHLAGPQEPSAIYIRSARMLSDWARQNISETLGLSDDITASTIPHAMREVGVAAPSRDARDSRSLSLSIGPANL